MLGQFPIFLAVSEILPDDTLEQNLFSVNNLGRQPNPLLIPSHFSKTARFTDVVVLLKRV